MTADDLRKLLLGTTWSWQHGWGSQQTTPVSFADDGTAHTDYWTAKFTVKNAKEVELQLGPARPYRATQISLTELARAMGNSEPVIIDRCR